MVRIIYRCLVWAHPPVFRREFSEEMLWIFDEASGEGTLPLVSDAITSLARQWLLRSGSWKVAAALAGAVIQVSLGGLGMLLFGQPRIASHVAAMEPHSAGALTDPATISLELLMRIVVWLVPGLLLSVILVSSWARKMARRKDPVLSRFSRLRAHA